MIICFRDYLIYLSARMEMKTKVQMEVKTEIQMEEGIKNISLRPFWYGKINWADWRSINPKLAEEYDNRKTKHNTFILYDYDKYISPVYNERREHINMMIENNKNYNKQIISRNNHDNHDNKDDFMTYSKKTKTYTKPYKKQYNKNNATNLFVDNMAYEIENQSFYNNHHEYDYDAKAYEVEDQTFSNNYKEYDYPEHEYPEYDYPERDYE